MTWHPNALPYISRVRYDDEIFKHLGEAFPELMEEPYEKITKIDEDWMKSADGKKRWREYIETYKDKIQDYNFGSCLTSKLTHSLINNVVPSFYRTIEGKCRFDRRARR